MSVKIDPGSKRFRIADILVVLIFISAAAFSFHLFWSDLFRSLDSRDEEPVGIIVIRKNVVQRRFTDRSLWDRLFVDSPVYSGDLIRVAGLSAATLNVDKNSIDLNENTLIRIDRTDDTRVPVEIELSEGNISLAAGTEGSALMLNLFGSRVEAGPGTVLNAETGAEGMMIQVNEGSARFFDEGSGETRELEVGTMIAMDSSGAEVARKAAVVTRPAPNARFLKNTAGPLPVSFEWNRINLEEDDTLRLDIASDRNFSKIVSSVETDGSTAQVSVENGQWYWRLCDVDEVLTKGRFTAADASGPDLTSPVSGSVFRYLKEPPQIRFQWSARPDSSHYIIEISKTPDFADTEINREAAAVSFIYSGLGDGTWYWRVRSVFSPIYEGTAAYSSVSFFRVEKTADQASPALELPLPAPALDPLRPVPGQEYTVKRGDTLSEIALAAYGNASRWSIISSVNNVPNPDRIKTGQKFFIPLGD